MGKQSLLERISWWFAILPEKIVQSLCYHRKIVSGFSAEVFLKDKWERCSGAGFCSECHKDFIVYVPANDEEIDNIRTK